MSIRTEGFDARYTFVSLLGPADDTDIREGQHGLALSADSTALFIGTREQLLALLTRATMAARSLPEA